MHWQQLDTFNGSAKLRSCTLRTREVSYYCLRSCYHVIWAAVTTQVHPTTALQTGRMARETRPLEPRCEQMCFASRSLPAEAFLGQGDCQDLTACFYAWTPAMPTVVQTSIILAVLTTTRKERKKCKLQFSPNRKARLCSHPIPFIFSAPSFLFSIPSIKSL